jgi:Coenzyme PQQ synthesis protein D (PqqD)
MITVAPQIRSVVDHDGAVILDIPRNTMTTLDSTGAYVWARLQRGMQVDAIVAELARDTGTDEATIAKDVEEFMEQLKAKHLVCLS